MSFRHTAITNYLYKRPGVSEEAHGTGMREILQVLDGHCEMVWPVGGHGFAMIIKDFSPNGPDRMKAMVQDLRELAPWPFEIVVAWDSPEPGWRTKWKVVPNHLGKRRKKG